MDIIWGLFLAFLDQIVFNTIGLIVVMFVVCMVLHRPGMGFKFFLFWLAVCAAVFYFVDPSAGIWGFLCYFIVIGADTNEAAPKKQRPVSSGEEEEKPGWRFYGDGRVEVRKISNTGYVDTKGNETWEDLLGNEHRHNGEVIMKNAYLKNRYDIYKDNVCIGYYYKDAVGVIQRVDYQ